MILGNINAFPENIGAVNHTTKLFFYVVIHLENLNLVLLGRTQSFQNIVKYGVEKNWHVTC